MCHWRVLPPNHDKQALGLSPTQSVHGKMWEDSAASFCTEIVTGQECQMGVNIGSALSLGKDTNQECKATTHFLG